MSESNKRCSAAKFDGDLGRWQCSISGDGCIYYIPDPKRCAKEYGEGPDSVSTDESEKK